MPSTRSIMASWQTTLLGVCLILIAVGSAGKALLDGDPTTYVNWQAFVVEIMIGIGLLAGKDADK